MTDPTLPYRILEHRVPGDFPGLFCRGGREHAAAGFLQGLVQPLCRESGGVPQI